MKLILIIQLLLLFTSCYVNRNLIDQYSDPVDVNEVLVQNRLKEGDHINVTVNNLTHRNLRILAVSDGGLMVGYRGYKHFSFLIPYDDIQHLDLRVGSWQPIGIYVSSMLLILYLLV